MARHKVVSFEVNINSSKKWVVVHIQTELKKPYKFRLTPDVNYPTLDYIEEKLVEALTHCVETFEKVDISKGKDDPYVWINVKDFISSRFMGTVA